MGAMKNELVIFEASTDDFAAAFAVRLAQLSDRDLVVAVEPTRRELLGHLVYEPVWSEIVLVGADRRAARLLGIADEFFAELSAKARHSQARSAESLRLARHWQGVLDRRMTLESPTQKERALIERATALRDRHLAAAAEEERAAADLLRRWKAAR